MKAINQAMACSLPLVPKPIVAAIAKRYVAGETLTDAVKAVRDFQQKGILATLDILGEEVKEKAKAFLQKEFGAEVSIFVEDDTDRYDPKNRASLAKPYRTAIFIE